MVALIAALLSRAWGYVAGLGAALALIGAVYAKGRKDASTGRKIKDMEDEQKTRDRMDGIDTSGDDVDWLSKRGKR